MMTRTERLLDELGWSQKRMGAFLGLDQSRVSALVRGQQETGPVSRLLDALEAAIARGAVARGVTPERCLAIICDGPVDPSADSAVEAAQ